MVGKLEAKDIILLVQVDGYEYSEAAQGETGGSISSPKGSSTLRGLVIASRKGKTHLSGWIHMERQTVAEKPLPKGSWMTRACYRVRAPSTLRHTATLNSEHVCEVEPGDEVLVLEFGTTYRNDARPTGGESCTACLRARVQTRAGFVGWLSPETAKGERLLDQVDLLSKDVCQKKRASISGAVTSAGLDAHDLATLPWKPGGQYRALETLHMRQEKELNSRRVCRLQAGVLLNVNSTAFVPCPRLGSCPCAHVEVQDGSQKGKRGWVRCSNTKGLDVLNVRDHLGFEKAMQAADGQQKLQQLGGHHNGQEWTRPTPLTKSEDSESDEESDYEDEESEEEEVEASEASDNSPEASPKGRHEPQPPEVFAPAAPEAAPHVNPVSAPEPASSSRPLRAMEESARDDMKIEDLSNIAPERTFGNCNCACTHDNQNAAKAASGEDARGSCVIA